jgi:hypothetical protein
VIESSTTITIGATAASGATGGRALAARELHGIEDQDDAAVGQHGRPGDAGDARELGPDVLDHHLAVAEKLVDMDGHALIRAAHEQDRVVVLDVGGAALA